MAQARALIISAGGDGNHGGPERGWWLRSNNEGPKHPSPKEARMTNHGRIS